MNLRCNRRIHKISISHQFYNEKNYTFINIIENKDNITIQMIKSSFVQTSLDWPKKYINVSSALKSAILEVIKFDRTYWRIK